MNFTIGKESPDRRQGGTHVPRIDRMSLDSGSQLFLRALRAREDHDSEALTRAQTSMRMLVDHMGEEYCRPLVEDIADRVAESVGVPGKQARLPVLRDLCSLFRDVDWCGLARAEVEGRA